LTKGTKGIILNFWFVILKNLLVTTLGQRMSKNELEKVLESKFFSSAGFAEEIENLVLNNADMNYIDAIVYFCDKNSIDVESVPKLIPKPLKEKIKYEAQELNFLKRSSRARLPL
jgi:hypothetical protein